MSFFDEHDPGCSPRKACRRCELYKILKRDISCSDDFLYVTSAFDHYLTQARGEAAEAGGASVTDWPEERRRFLDQSTDELDISVRAARGLRFENILTVRELVMKKESEMLRIPNFGYKALTEIKEVLIPHNLRFGMIPGELPPQPSTE